MKLLGALCGATLLLGLLVTAPSPATGGAPGTPDARRPDKRPNVVLITTDDQTLRDMSVMPTTRRLLQRKGMTFRGLSPHPLCCPARAEILTGQFAQNNGVYSNKGPHGGYSAFDPSSTIATWLHRAGYSTAFLGKFLNRYRVSSTTDATPGWDKWHPTVSGVYNYTDFTIDHNGTPTRYAHSYQTDVYADLGVNILGKLASRDRPFFMWQSFVAPHNSCAASNELRCWGPPVAARRHARLFPAELPPSFRDPAFNEVDVSDKPRWVRERSRLTDRKRSHLILVHQQRLRALQAVDEAVGRMVAKLRRTGSLANTLIIFTSDNGYLLGEHRLSGKNVPYEPALNVPFIMRGPGIPAGVTSKRAAAIVDIAPTIAAAAGVRPRLRVDGRNLLSVVDGSDRGWTTMLIQAGALPAFDDVDAWFFRGVRTSRYTYVSYPRTRETELYDRRFDPSQLTNVTAQRRYRDVRRELAGRLAVLRKCSGAACRRPFGRLPALRGAG